MMERAVNALDDGWADSGLEPSMRHAWEAMGRELDRIRAMLGELPEAPSPAPVVVHKAKVAILVSKGPAPFKVVDSRRFQEVALSLGVARDEMSKDNVWQRFEHKQIEKAFGGAIRWS